MSEFNEEGAIEERKGGRCKQCLGLCMETWLAFFFCHFFFINTHGMVKMEDLHQLLPVFLTHHKEKETFRLVY